MRAAMRKSWRNLSSLRLNSGGRSAYRLPVDGGGGAAGGDEQAASTTTSKPQPTANKKGKKAGAGKKGKKKATGSKVAPE